MPSPSTPNDWQKQIIGDFLLGYINYPLIMGSDLSGTIVEVSPDAKRIQVNDRVVAEGNSTGGAFQHHTLVHEHMASPLPDYVSHEQACVVPLTLYCTTVLKQHPHTARKFIAMASGRGGFPVGDKLHSFFGKAVLFVALQLSILKQTVPSRFIGVMVKFIDFKDACEPDGPVARIYKGYMSRALA
ncbi:hypothetical protein PG999_012179 [Apiospora kogelbergensis]|uniref:Alcohol dehydrogenase-like N-terminal domain-containing protein n=1 Tax=Apiospora kogelbergensis TaxID=1337665 RepID=A0AAW0QF77_9PEZI